MVKNKERFRQAIKRWKIASKVMVAVISIGLVAWFIVSMLKYFNIL